LNNHIPILGVLLAIVAVAAHLFLGYHQASVADEERLDTTDDENHRMPTEQLHSHNKALAVLLEAKTMEQPEEVSVEEATSTVPFQQRYPGILELGSAFSMLFQLFQ